MPPPTVSGGVSTPDLYLERRGELFLTHTTSEHLFDLRAIGREFDYETEPYDRTEIGGYASFLYNFTAVFSGTLFGYRTETEYRDTARVDNDSQVGLRFFYRFGRNLIAILETRYDG